MQMNGLTDFTVALGEQVTIVVAKTIAPYQASFSELDGATWAQISKPNDLTEM